MQSFSFYERKIAVLVALYTAICFFMIIGEPTFLEPFLSINIRRVTNFLGLWILFFSIPVYIIIYKINLLRKNLLGFKTEDFLALNRGILTSITLGVFGGVSLLNFNPFPNIWVLSNTIIYCASVGWIVYAQYVDIGELTLTKEESIEINARIEILRLAHTTCLEILKTIITLTVAFGAGIILSAWQQMRQAGLSVIEANIFYGFLCLNMAWWSCGILFGLVRELLWRMWEFRKALANLKN